VEGVIKVGDPFADQVADPWNDEFIPNTVFPNLPTYDKTDYGVATVLQTGQPKYEWPNSENNWVKHDQEKLVVYELLVRDFVGSHDYKDVIDSLSYLKSLGINAIELMPIMEFEGNSSWGYNPSYYFAPDKYYGTKNDLKDLISACHAEGIAVLLEMVLNHSFGQSPMVMMYFDSENGKPSTDNPWFNPDARHPFNVGYDFNHESSYTKGYIDKVNKYWMDEYHFDGYRFDLSKGFTQTNNPDDIGAWGQLDQSRIDILTRMADIIWETDPTAYVILEHFADQAEETILKDAGMMVWGNSNNDVRQLLAGNGSASANALKEAGRVSYIESHDEERLVYEMLEFGRSSGTYDTRNLSVALNRSKLAAAFFYTLPGPKMLWQFQELGYDIDINFSGRTGEKPLPWGTDGLGYYQDLERQKLYHTTAEIINLTNTYAAAFDEGSLTTTLSGDIRTISIEHQDLSVEIAGNFSLSEQSKSVSFSKVGDWYDYFTGDTLTIDATSIELRLAPGQFYFFTDQPIFSANTELVDIFKNIVVPDPAEFNSTQEVSFTFDAAAADPNGTQGLVGAENIYLYAGVVLEPGSTEVSDFIGTLDGEDLGSALTPIADEENKWLFTLTIRDYFNIPEGERIYKVAMKFRDETGTNVGTNTGGEFIFFDLLPDMALNIVTISPAEFGSTDNITITYDAEASEPAGALLGATEVYMHSGVVTVENGSSWELVVGNWGQDDGIGKMAKVTGETNKWQISMTPRNYYQVPQGTSVYRLGMVFRNGDGSKEGKDEGQQDIFIDVPIIDDGVPTGISEKLESNFTTYPNPTFDQFYVRLSNISTLSTALLTDLSGKKIREWRNMTAQNGDFKFGLSGIDSGIYFLSFTSGSTRYATRIIKK
jgi:glycosidase